MRVFLCVLGLCASPTPLLQEGGPPRVTLEDLLERARAERDRLYEQLRTIVLEKLERIDDEPLPAPRARRVMLVEEVIALGPESAPLLVSSLEPGPAPLDRERFRASVVTEALTRMDTRVITRNLLQLLERGTQQGKHNALEVLASSPERERVRPALVEVFRGSEGALRERALQALLAVPDPANDELLTEVLASGEPKLVDMGLEALTATRNERAAEVVGELLRDARKARPHAEELLGYYRAVPRLAKEPEILALVALAAERTLASETRQAILDALPEFDPSLNGALRQALQPILSEPKGKLSDAGLVLLSVLGDRGARKDLLESYDDLVDRNSSWPQGYARRADILRRIREYDDAIRDYKRAIELHQEIRGSQSEPDTYVGLARCYALKGRLKDARDALLKAPGLNMEQLRALKHDPDFRKLREHTRYGDVFPADG